MGEEEGRGGQRPSLHSNAFSFFFLFSKVSFLFSFSFLFGLFFVPTFSELIFCFSFPAAYIII